MILITQTSKEMSKKSVVFLAQKTIDLEKTTGEYNRFKIRTSPAPPRISKPYPFYPKVGKFGLFKTLLKEVFTYNFKLLKKEYRDTLLSRPCIYGVFSGPFGGFMPRREYCTGCLRCVQEYPEFCTVERNPAINKFADSYWQTKDITKEATNPYLIVLNEAEKGKIPVKGMGYKGSFADKGWDTIWTDMSEIVRPTRDGIYGREYISTETTIGSRSIIPTLDEHNPQFVKLSLPVIFDHLPDTISNKVVLESIAKASNEVGTVFIASPNQVSSLKLTDRLIMKISDLNELSFNVDPLGIEVDLPGLLGFNPYGEEVAKIYRNDSFDMIVSTIKKVKGHFPRKLLIIRLPLTESTGSFLVKLLKNVSFDAVHLYADYHGDTFADDFEIRQFIKDALRQAHETLVKEGIRDQISVIASGGIILAEHVPKAMICGADVTAINSTALVALQMKFKDECKNPYQSKIAPDSFNTDWGRQRLVNLLAAWHYQILEVLSAMGMRDVRRLRGDIGRAIFKEEIEKEAFGDIRGFAQKGGVYP